MTSPAWTPAAVDVALQRMFPQPDPYTTDPVAWTREKRGAHLWSKQREIIESVRDHRYTAVHAAHGLGKSWTAATAIAWWADTHPSESSFVVWTAPTYPQVAAVVGRELSQAIEDAGLTDIRLMGDQRLVVGERLIGYGRKPADHNMAAFQGIHAEHVLVVLDEACGIPRQLWDAADALATNEHARVLAIGNPDDASSHFAEVCDPARAAHRGWNVIHVDAFDSPNLTGEVVPEAMSRALISRTWVEERKARWGEKSAIYQAKVRGVFAPDAENAIVPLALVRRAQQIEATDPEPGKPLGAVLGCDIARGNSDDTDANTILSVERGRASIVAHFREPDLMRTADMIDAEARKLGPLTRIVVDGDGLGAGVVDALRQKGHDIVEFRGAQKARDPRRFRNRRAEAWWGLRELLQDDAIALPSDDGQGENLARDVSVVQRVVDSSGRTGAEGKDDIRKRLGRSPDLGDALMMAASVQPDGGDRRAPGERRGSRSITAGLLDTPF